MQRQRGRRLGHAPGGHGGRSSIWVSHRGAGATVHPLAGAGSLWDAGAGPVASQVHLAGAPQLAPSCCPTTAPRPGRLELTPSLCSVVRGRGSSGACRRPSHASGRCSAVGWRVPGLLRLSTPLCACVWRLFPFLLAVATRPWPSSARDPASAVGRGPASGLVGPRSVEATVLVPTRRFPSASFWSAPES